MAVGETTNLPLTDLRWRQRNIIIMTTVNIRSRMTTKPPTVAPTTMARGEPSSSDTAIPDIEGERNDPHTH